MEFKKSIIANCAVNCRTESDAESLLSWADAKGFKWASGSNLKLFGTFWDVYGPYTCYIIKESGVELISIRSCDYKNVKVVSFGNALLKDKR